MVIEADALGDRYTIVERIAAGDMLYRTKDYERSIDRSGPGDYSESLRYGRQTGFDESGEFDPDQLWTFVAAAMPTAEPASRTLVREPRS